MKIGRQVGWGGVRLLLELALRMELLQAAPGEGRRIDGAPLRLVALGHQRDQVVKILNALARAEVNAKPGAIQAGGVEQTRVGQSLLRGRGRELAVDAAMLPALGFLDVAA